MAALNTFTVFTDNLTSGKHDFSAHSFKVMLTNTAPSAGNAVKTDITDITAGNGYTAGGTATTTTRSNTSGVEKILMSNVVFTGSGGNIASFRYAVVYNDTQTTPAKPLVGYYDYGSSISPATGETFTVAFDQTNGVFTVG